MSDERFVDYGREWNTAGVQVIGGGCDFSVSHIKQMVNDLSEPQTRSTS